jgi:hypothetical protein
MRGETYARARLSTDRESTRSSLGPAPDGEVEDWKIAIQTNPFTNAAWNVDVNADGRVSSIDALQVINWLNDPTKPRDLSLASATFAPPFIDVNGDGRVSSLDALLVINYLNSRPPAGGGEGELSGEGESEGGWDAHSDPGALGVGQPESSRASGSSSNPFEQQMVLANDWIGGLLGRNGRSDEGRPRSSQPSTKPGQSHDLALISEAEEFMQDVHVERNQQASSASAWLANYEMDAQGTSQTDAEKVDALLEELFPAL